MVGAASLAFRKQADLANDIAEMHSPTSKRLIIQSL